MRVSRAFQVQRAKQGRNAPSITAQANRSVRGLFGQKSQHIFKRALNAGMERDVQLNSDRPKELRRRADQMQLKPGSGMKDVEHRIEARGQHEMLLAGQIGQAERSVARRITKP